MEKTCENCGVIYSAKECTFCMESPEIWEYILNGDVPGFINELKKQGPSEKDCWGNPVSIDFRGIYGDTPLLFFSGMPGTHSQIQTLVDEGADILKIDGCGDNVLMKAVIEDNFEIFPLLISLGADPDYLDKNGVGWKNLVYVPDEFEDPANWDLEERDEKIKELEDIINEYKMNNIKGE